MPKGRLRSLSLKERIIEGYQERGQDVEMVLGMNKDVRLGLEIYV